MRQKVEPVDGLATHLQSLDIELTQLLLLPSSVTAREANDARRLLAQALKSEDGDVVVVDASNLTQFDSSALAVLLECHRAADAWGKPFELRNAPPKLASLARLYGVDKLLIKSDL